VFEGKKINAIGKNDIPVPLEGNKSQNRNNHICHRQRCHTAKLHRHGNSFTIWNCNDPKTQPGQIFSI